MTPQILPPVSFEAQQNSSLIFWDRVEAAVDHALLEVYKKTNGVGNCILQYMKWIETKNPASLGGETKMVKVYNPIVKRAVDVRKTWLKNRAETPLNYATGHQDIYLIQTTGKQPDYKTLEDYLAHVSEGIENNFIITSFDSERHTTFHGNFKIPVKAFYGSTVLDEKDFRQARFVLLADEECKKALSPTEGLRIIQEVADKVQGLI